MQVSKSLSFLSLPYLNLRYYIYKTFGNLPQKGTFLAILVGENFKHFLAPSAPTMVWPP